MTTRIIIGLSFTVIAGLLSLNTLRAQPTNPSTGANGQQYCETYIDENGDGINDNAGQMHEGMHRGQNGEYHHHRMDGQNGMQAYSHDAMMNRGSRMHDDDFGSFGGGMMSRGQGNGAHRGSGQGTMHGRGM